MKTKKLINTAFFYCLLGLAGGVFYREFTKFSGFSGNTALSRLHLHLLVLGMFFFLLSTLFEKLFEISSHKSFTRFFASYNAGLLITSVIFMTRGVLQVREVVLSKGLDAAISGIAGIGHILLLVGFLYFFSALRAKLVPKDKA